MPQQPADNAPAVNFESRVTGGITTEVLTALRAPGGGLETGGLLLGRRAGRDILVEDFEPALCEHTFGAAYILSDEDVCGLAESVEWFRSANAGPLEVLGFYRSQTRADSAPDDRDRELVRRFVPDSQALFLLLKPGLEQALTAELFAVAEGSLRPAASAVAFPDGAPIAIARLQLETSVAALPPPRPRREEPPEESPGWNWTWVAALVALTILGAVLGYRSVPKRSVSVTPMVSPAPSAARFEVANAASIPSRPAIASGAEPEIRAAIEQWERAQLSGDPDLIAACYAPQPDRHFTPRMARYGKPAILRLSGLTIVPISENRAVGSFRKHWQTSGPRIFAGEEQERLTFIKDQDAWKIASEEETKVYWTQRPR